LALCLPNVRIRLGVRKVVVLFHGRYCAYRALSDGTAFRAEMMRTTRSSSR
jgi:hypothetical protein